MLKNLQLPSSIRRHLLRLISNSILHIENTSSSMLYNLNTSYPRNSPCFDQKKETNVNQEWRRPIKKLDDQPESYVIPKEKEGGLEFHKRKWISQYAAVVDG
jgi:hypothetical protein